MSNKPNTKNRKMKLRIPLAAAGVLGVGLGASAMIAPSVAFADSPTTYTANLTPVPINGDNGGSGTLTLVLNGSQATITEQASGLAATFMNAPYPHVQHIHGPGGTGGGGVGACPTASADTNGDGVISTTEGQPAYGAILTTLSVTGDTSPAAGTAVTAAPSGASFNYSRTITLDAPTVAAITSGKAVIVVHGLDPTTAAPAAASSKSELVPSLPLAATSPALCGVLSSSQMSAVPSGGVHTGGGSTANVQDLSLFVLGGALLLGGGGIVAARKVRGARVDS